jgi:hypothetical protein
MVVRRFAASCASSGSEKERERRCFHAGAQIWRRRDPLRRSPSPQYLHNRGRFEWIREDASGRRDGLEVAVYRALNTRSATPSMGYRKRAPEISTPVASTIRLANEVSRIEWCPERGSVATESKDLVRSLMAGHHPALGESLRTSRRGRRRRAERP